MPEMIEERLANLSLSADEEEELTLDVGENRSARQYCDLGSFLMDRQINYTAMKHCLASLWRPGKGVSIKKAVGQHCMFQFYHPIDMKRVLDGGPWTSNNHLMILNQLRQGEIPTVIPLYHILKWVLLYDIPVG